MDETVIRTHAGQALPRAQAQQYIGVSDSTFARLRKRPDFPRPRMIGEGCVRWLARELDAWLAAQPVKEVTRSTGTATDEVAVCAICGARTAQLIACGSCGIGACGGGHEREHVAREHEEIADD